MPYTTLISPAEVAEHLQEPDWAIIDCRFSLADPSLGQQHYLESHIPGALYAHLDDDLSGAVVPGQTGRHPLPVLEAFTTRLSKWGIDGRVQVVAYDDMSGVMASRLWWMLRWLGHEHVAILDGDWRLWQALDLPVSSDQETRIARHFVAQPCAHLYVSAEEVAASLERGDRLLFDSRSADRFRGENETLDPKAGHIPGAISAPYSENLDLTGRFLSQPDLRARYSSLLGDAPAADAIFYCGSGVSAAHNLLALLHAGLGDARLYVGSWSEWITNPDRPIATGPDN